jgi:O-antigen ligase
MPETEGARFTVEPGQYERASRSATLMRIGPLAILLASICVVAPEVNFDFGDLLFPPYRTLIIILLLAIVPQLASGRVKMGMPDVLVGVSILWVFTSFIIHYGFSEGMVRSSAVAFDTGGAYLIARSCIQTFDDLRRVLVLLTVPMAFAGAIMVAESFGHTYLWRPFLASIFGPLSAFSEGEATGTLQISVEVRLGLQRALGPFSHPILGGVILISPLPLYYLSGLRSWPRVTGTLVSFLGFFSLSSAAILALLVGVGSIVVNYLLRFIRGLDWRGVAGLLGFAALIVQFGSRGGIIDIVSRMTLTPGTAYYRQLIWEYGWRSMLEHPLIGIGYSVYDRPSWMSTSIDAHFLALGIRFGFVTPTCLLLALLAIMVSLGRRSARCPANDRNLLIGMNLTLAILLISAMTVTFFSEANVWFMAFIGMGAALVKARPESYQQNMASPPSNRLQGRSAPAPQAA